jgi:hypothetical protein
MFIKKTGYPVWTKANCVRVVCYTSSFTSLFETLSNAETNLGVDILTLSLISILIVAVIMFSISAYVGANASAWVGLLLLGILTYVNWFDWRFYAVMLMGYIGYTLMQGGTN